MCGIFGIALRQDAKMSRSEYEELLEKLYLHSESRGKESAGLHILLPLARKAWTIKGALPASELIKSKEYRKYLFSALDLVYTGDRKAPVQPIVAIAHSRLVTNGRAELQKNNQPVRWGEVTVIHNGIIVNVDDLWRGRPDLERTAEVDTEILAALLSDEMASNFDTVSATSKVFSAIEGAASVAWLHSHSDELLLATNTGDLYFSPIERDRGVMFASEQFILESASSSWLNADKPKNIAAGRGYCFSLASDLRTLDFAFADGTSFSSVASEQSIEHYDYSFDLPSTPSLAFRDVDETLLRYNEVAMREIRRCSSCVLPETFPFIEFDEHGVCNYCNCYRPNYKGIDPESATNNFIQSLHKYRSVGSTPDVLVPFSGGRDSCYGLHLIKKEFGLNPITFTYDWGMVTDLARRNIARFCGSLGVQNILVSADIKVKRENIRKNVSAWLKRPDLGMVPLFMAGDKHFFQILNVLKKQTGIDLNIWSANPLENTDFKVGLCGVSPVFNKSRVDHLSAKNKIRLLSHYALGFITNPRMINSSIVDTGSAFLSYYFEPRRDFVSLFHHLVWDERVVNDTIISQYGFEIAPDSPSTWRIGDGTAPFYNYIYVTANGFSEFDTFRSNQIREGQISREYALECVVKENRPRVDGLRWYLETIGLDFNSVIGVINDLDVRGLHR